MTQDNRDTHVYVGLGGEGENIGPGGIYRRAQGEQEWQSVARGLPSNPQVRALLVNPANPQTVYAGTQSGIFRSDDRGEHWEALEGPSQGMDVWSLAFHPKDPNIIFAGYEPCSIYRSDNGGATWRQMNTEGVTFPDITTYMHPLAKRVISITIDPSNPDEMYAAIEVGGLLASRDGGESWEQLIDGPYVRNNTLDVHAVEVSAAAPGTVYMATQIALFRGRDKGHRWQHIQVEDMFPGGSYCRSLLVDPNEPKTIFLASGAGGGAAPQGTAEAGALFRSRDAGESWERLDLGDTPSSRMMQIAVDPADSDRVYCSTHNGQVYASDDRATTWTKSRLPLETSRSRHVYAMACG